MPDGRVLIAFDDPPLEPTPTWTRIDDTDNLVAQMQINRGRQTETEQTDTSQAVVKLNDKQGLFDPDNVSSPYFGQLDGKAIMLQVRNPVTGLWVPQYRGVIDDYGYDFEPSQVVSNIQVQCVDMFAYLAGVQMVVGVFGATPPDGSEGTVYYGPATVKDRIEGLLFDAAVPGDMSVVFTGNVDDQGTKYDFGDSMLVALRDAADSEFPGIANLYTDKIGRFVFHGRKARFDPDTVSMGADWTFTRWKAGDGVAILADDERAQIRPPLGWSRPRGRIVNVATAYPRGMAESDMAGQVVSDSGSIAAYGYRAWSAPDLITAAGTTTGNDAKDECKLFAEWRVANYKFPRTLVEALSFRSMHPSDDRAAASWALMCSQDISDIVNLEHGYPGGSGLAGEDFYIEGSSMTVLPLNPDFDDVSLTLNVSPASDYSDDVFS